MSILRKVRYFVWYLRKPPWDSGITPPELIEFISAIPAGRAIDLGCGTGTNVVTLAQMGWQVTGLDFIPAAIRQARTKAKTANLSVDLRVGDVVYMNGIHGDFDLALDLGCFHSLPWNEKQGYLSSLDRILKPGGIWFVYGFLHPESEKYQVGFTEKEVEELKKRFLLVSSQVNKDQRGRPSAYFIFKKPEQK